MSLGGVGDLSHFHSCHGNMTIHLKKREPQQRSVVIVFEFLFFSFTKKKKKKWIRLVFFFVVLPVPGYTHHGM